MLWRQCVEDLADNLLAEYTVGLRVQGRGRWKGEGEVTKPLRRLVKCYCLLNLLAYLSLVTAMSLRLDCCYDRVPFAVNCLIMFLLLSCDY